MSFLDLKDREFLLAGVANRKSIAAHVARTLLEEGAKIRISVQNEAMISKLEKLFPGVPFHVCDVEDEKSVEKLGETLRQDGVILDGLVHSIAFANYGTEMKPFHETGWNDFQQAVHISAYSFVSLARALYPVMRENGSVVTLSISDTRATSYGYMGPIKAMLDSSVAFLAKSFSGAPDYKNIRVNAVCAGPLKTAASAGIPGYIDNYLYAEKLTLRNRALETKEVGDTVTWLLSPRSSGINATGIKVDAGMSCNTFDQKVVKTTMEHWQD